MARAGMPEAVAKTVDYIEEHIRERIVLDEIAAAANLSKYHLHRIFKAVTGHSLMEYARLRKLTHSLDLLLQSDLRVLDIAMEYRFSHEQSYTRAFKSFFRVSPAEFRRDKPALRIQEKIDPGSLKSIGDGILVQPVIMLKPRFLLIGMRTLVGWEEDRRAHVANRLGRDFYYGRASCITNALRPWVYIGLVQYVDGNAGRSYYMPSLEVSSLESIPDGMTGEAIPTNKYAVFKYIGFFHPDRVNVEDLFQILGSMESWLAASGYERAGAYHFESIDTTVARDDYCEVDLYLPIR